MDSSLLYFSSELATVVDPVYGNGRFTCNMGNVNRAGTHAVKIVPHKILIPNVFENVAAHQTSFALLSGSPFTVGAVSTWTSASSLLAPGFYSLDRLLSSLNYSFLGKFTFTFNPVTMSVEIVCNLDVDEITVFQIHESIGAMIGITNNPQAQITNGILTWTQHEVNSLVFDPLNPYPSSLLAAADLPVILSTPLVHVIARRLADQNLLANDSVEYNVLASVSMENAPYGAYAVYTTPDASLDDILFRTPRNLHEIDFEIVDHNFKQLAIDVRLPVIVQLKVFHTDTVTRG